VLACAGDLFWIKSSSPEATPPMEERSDIRQIPLSARNPRQNRAGIPLFSNIDNRSRET
jgi:hypothetical protein